MKVIEFIILFCIIYLLLDLIDKMISKKRSYHNLIIRNKNQSETISLLIKEVDKLQEKNKTLQAELENAK